MSEPDVDVEAAAGGFATGLAMLRQRGLAKAEVLPPVEAYQMNPVLTIASARESWNAFLEVRSVVMEDPACFDEIAGHREMNRTGATRLATYFGLSMETLSVLETDVSLPGDDRGAYSDHRFLVRVRVSKSARYADGVGSCRVSEIPEKTNKGETIPLSQREHFALTKAATRAAKRAIADILGGAGGD